MKIKIYTPPKYDELDLEIYLIHVVPSEVSPKWHIETLKAQAIASRTYAFNCIHHPRHLEGDVCSGPHCQVYKSDIQNWKTTKAVGQTEGQILVFDNFPAIALYHASCGGWTENCEDVFKQALPYLVRTACYCKEAFPSVRRNGHGVGMCQWGAEAMARQGSTFDEILNFYYPGCTIEPITNFNNA